MEPSGTQGLPKWASAEPLPSVLLRKDKRCWQDMAGRQTQRFPMRTWGSELPGTEVGGWRSVPPETSPWRRGEAGPSFPRLARGGGPGAREPGWAAVWSWNLAALSS